MDIKQITQLTNNHTLRWYKNQFPEPYVVFKADLVLPDHRFLEVEYCRFIDLHMGSGATYLLKGSLSGVPVFDLDTDADFERVIKAAALDYVTKQVGTPREAVPENPKGFVIYSQTTREVYAGEGNWTKDISKARVYASNKELIEDGVIGGLGMSYERARDLLAADTLEKQIALDMRTATSRKGERSIIQEGSLDTLLTLMGVP